MKVNTLSHSDQILSTLAKLPVSAFGTQSTKEVVLALASKMNKKTGWSTCCYLRTIAKAVGCTTRTVRSALRRLESLGFIITEHRKHEQIELWNMASVYKLGKAILSHFRTSHPTIPGKSFDFKQHKQKNIRASFGSHKVTGNEDKRPTSDVVYGGVNAEQAAKNVGCLAALKKKLGIA